MGYCDWTNEIDNQALSIIPAKYRRKIVRKYFQTINNVDNVKLRLNLCRMYSFSTFC